MFSYLYEKDFSFFPNINFPKGFISSYPKSYINLINEWTVNAKKEPKLPSIALSEISWKNTCITINYKPIFFKDFKVKVTNNVFHLFDSNGVYIRGPFFKINTTYLILFL